MSDLIWTPAVELARAVRDGELSSKEITQAFLERSKEVNDALGAYLEVSDEQALEQAEAADERRGSNQSSSSIDGVPIAYKDVFSTKGVPTTAGSRILEGFTPPYDSTVVARGHVA